MEISGQQGMSERQRAKQAQPMATNQKPQEGGVTLSAAYKGFADRNNENLNHVVALLNTPDADSTGAE